MTYQDKPQMSGESVEANTVKGSMELNDILDQKEERARNAVQAWRQGADDAESVAIVETDVPALVKALRDLWDDYRTSHMDRPPDIFERIVRRKSEKLASILKGNTP